MEYAILLLPHANARYQASQRKLALGALNIFANAFEGISDIGYKQVGPLELLCFSFSGDAHTLKAISQFSMGYGLFRVEEEALYPVSGLYSPPFSDMAGILKYKGKTNEAFTALLLEIAVYSSAFAAEYDRPLRILDPMCGRGTSLFAALARGYMPCGIEKDKKQVHEMDAFIGNYMKYNRYKHETVRQSMTLEGRAAAQRTQVSFSEDPARYKAGVRRQISYVNADARDAHKVYKGEKFHALLCDLPYSIQHAASVQDARVKPEQLVRQMMPKVDALLLPGAGIAFSFNRYTADRHLLEEDLKDMGYLVLTQPPYDGFEHWVEQAVMRDIIVARKP